MSPGIPLSEADLELMLPEDRARLEAGTFRQPREDTKDMKFKRKFGATRNGQLNREGAQSKEGR